MDKKYSRPLRYRSLESSVVIEGVGALIYAKDTGRYLFLLRNNGSYAFTWGLPGGKLTFGESMDKGLAREINEELGGTINDAVLILIERFVSQNKKFIYHTYFVSVDTEFVPVLNDEHIGYAWLPLASAPKPLHPGLTRTLNSESVKKKIAITEKNS